LRKKRRTYGAPPFVAVNLSARQVHEGDLVATVENALARDGDDRAIVSAIMAMARSLDLMVTAEGVERTDQVAFLREAGCEQVQGYLFGRPGPAQDFERLLARPAASALSLVGDHAA
jgi:EAL domain-containing protein (putative c-di-GMP-specific phosphodiesterase class I)